MDKKYVAPMKGVIGLCRLASECNVGRYMYHPALEWFTSHEINLFLMQATYLKRVTEHFSTDVSDDFDIAVEVQIARQAADVRRIVPLSKQGVAHLSQYWPPVKNANDLDTLANRLKKGEEFGFSTLFDPSLIDACCQRGIFPLSIGIGNGIFIFAPKLHVGRAICALVDDAAQRDTIGGFSFGEGDDGIFDRECLGVSRKLIKAPNESTRAPSFDIFVNRDEDVADVLTLIRRQHGENWLCAPLRMCFLHMFFNPTKYSTKIIITAIRRRKYNDVFASENRAMIQEGELAAGEIGYLVGDIYASATGGYCINGGGALQLSLTGMLMRIAGCRVWDLGMMMNYKQCMRCISLPRPKWQSMVSVRRLNSSQHIFNYLQDLKKGRSVSDFFKSNLPPAVADPNSKSQLKKRLKKEAAIQRKLDRRKKK